MLAGETGLYAEANRQLVICNACRYCEGLCPVFRAIETRRDFAKGDVFYLANLCHDCRACYYACMFTPPHQFEINIPRILAQARLESYKHWSWPGVLGRAFQEPWIGSALAGIAAVLVIATGAALISPGRLFAGHTGPGAFYAVVPYLAMVIPALVLVLFGLGVWLRGGVRSWAETNNPSRTRWRGKELFDAIVAALTLRHLDGGGPGCDYPGERPNSARRVYHAFVFWGFLADFVSTTLAFIYEDFLHLLPPYPLASGPVLFGSAGGILLIVGVAGLMAIKHTSDRNPALESAYSLDHIFLGTLGITALTGMLTLIFRATPALGVLLVVHLACVAALFVTAPYGKFVHAIYRSLALVRYYAERSL